MAKKKKISRELYDNLVSNQKVQKNNKNVKTISQDTYSSLVSTTDRLNRGTTQQNIAPVTKTTTQNKENNTQKSFSFDINNKYDSQYKSTGKKIGDYIQDSSLKDSEIFQKDNKFYYYNDKNKAYEEITNKTGYDTKKNTNAKEKKQIAPVSEHFNNKKQSTINATGKFEEPTKTVQAREDKLGLADRLSVDFSGKSDDDKKKMEDQLVQKEKDNARLAGVANGLKDSGYIKAGAFEDGYQFGDVTKTAGSTILSGFNSIGRGAMGMVEGVGDAINYVLAGVEDKLGLDDLAKTTREFAKRDLVDEITMPSSEAYQDSVLGSKSDSIVESIGGMLPSIALGGMANTTKGATALTSGSMFTSSYGQGVSEAYANGATDEEAQTYGLISGIAETATEMMFGGLGKGSKALGVSKSAIPIDDALAQAVSSKFKSKLAQNLTTAVIKSSGEGFEEVASGILQGIGKKMTFESDKELSNILKDEQLLDQFIGGAVASGIMQTPGLVKSTKQRRSLTTNYTDNEQKVVDNVTDSRFNEQLKDNPNMSKKEQNQLRADIEEQAKNDLDSGNLTPAEIQNALGNDDYQAYKQESQRKQDLENQLKELQSKSATDMSYSEYNENNQKIADLQNEIDSINLADLKTRADTPVENRIQNNDYLLQRSYNNYQNNQAQKNVVFEYQPQTDSKGKEVQVSDLEKNVYDSAVRTNMNNTKESHNLADFVSKLSKDTGIQYEFTTTEDLKNRGYNVDKRVINGLNTDDGKILINVDSDSIINRVVGHETTHLFENTEDYQTLQNEVFEYAKTKGDFDKLKAELTEAYKNVKGANIDNELTSELVGQYVFSDTEFVQNLSKHRNIFQKVYDEIKHLYKMATAGSKEARQLEKVKHTFEKVYQNNQAHVSTETEYHVSKNISDDIDKVLNDINERTPVKLRDFTPQVLVQNGIKDLPMYENPSHIRKNILTEAEAKKLGLKINPRDNYHGLGKELYIKAIDSLDNPRVILKNNNNNNYLVVTVIKDKNGNSIVTPIEIETQTSVNKVMIDINRIKSVYGYERKNNIDLNDYIKYNLKNKNFTKIYEQKKERGTGFSTVASSSANNVSQSNSNVKSNTSNIKYALTSKNNTLKLEERVSGDKLLDTQDLINEISSVGANVDDNGYVTVYHVTTPENAQKIIESKKMTANEPAVFFSTSKNAQQSEGRGNITLEFKIPAEKLQLDDIFSDNADVKIPLNNYLKDSLDVSEYLMTNNTENSNTSSFSVEQHKQQQLDIIQNNNPAGNDVATWIRSTDDIKTFEETLQDDDWSIGDDFDPDYTWDMAQEALNSGKITVYSSYPIEQGIFVTPSKMEAESYSGYGKVYSKTVNLQDVAWIDPTQGQYAKVDNTQYSLNNDNLVPLQEGEVQSRDVRNENRPIAPLPNNIQNQTNTQNANVSNNTEVVIPTNNTQESIQETTSTNKTLNPAEIAQIRPENASTTPKIDNIKVSTGDGKSHFFDNIKDKVNMLSEDSKAKILSSDEVKYYKEVTNEDSLNKAFTKLADNGEVETRAWFNKASEKATDVDVAEGWILMKQYEDVGDYDGMVQVAKKMREIGTKAGQTVQAFNIMNRMTPEGMVKYAQSELSEAYEQMVKGKTKKWIDQHRNDFELKPEEVKFIMDNMQEVSTMKDGYDKKVKLAEIQKLMTDKIPPAKGQGIKAWMRISMLFNPKTQVRNVAGNALIAPVNAFGDLFASGMDRLVARKTGVRTVGTTSLKNYSKGMRKGLFESYNDFKKGINTRDISGNRFEIGEGKSFNEKTMIGKSLNRVDNLLSFMLDAGDRMFYEGSFVNSINNQMVLNNTDIVTQDMIDIATQEALSRTWQDNNKYTQFVLSVRRMMNNINVKGYGLGDILIPFAKTPANLTKALVDYSPAGMVSTLIKGYDLKKSINNGQYTAQMQHEFVQSLGKATAGTALYILGYALAKAGILSGESDDDKDVSNFMKNTMGVNSYSIKIGDKSFTYDWAQPIAGPFSMMANLVNKQDQEASLGEKITSTLDTAGNIILEQSFMESINTVLSNNDGIATGIEEALLDLPARAVPTVMKQITDMVDGTQRVSFEYDKPLESAINSIKAKIPGLSQTLAPSVDSMGREIQKYGGKNSIFNVFFNPANVNNENISESAKEIYRVYKQTGDSTILPRVAPYYVNSDGEKIVLDSKQREKLQKRSGTLLEQGLDNMMKNDTYINASDEDKAEMINGLVNYSYDIAQHEVVGTELSQTYEKAYNFASNGGNIENYYIYKYSVKDMDSNEKEKYLYNSDFSEEQKTLLYENITLSDFTDESKYLNYKTAKQLGVDINNWLNYSSQEFKSDLAPTGKTISGSRKKKLISFVNSLNLTIPQKASLIKMSYSSYDNYDKQIMNEVNSLNISFMDKAKMVKTLGFDEYDKSIINYIDRNYSSMSEKTNALKDLGFTVYTYKGRTYVR